MSNPIVIAVFDKYPASVSEKLLHLRSIILDVAKETEGLTELKEELKWGEPSYLTKHGSTIRIDWKEKTPNQYAIYFKCTSQLVPTMKLLYKEIFHFEGNRAIVFDLKQEIPRQQLEHCISLALTYHKVKHLPLLGAHLAEAPTNKG